MSYKIVKEIFISYRASSSNLKYPRILFYLKSLKLLPLWLFSKEKKNKHKINGNMKN